MKAYARMCSYAHCANTVVFPFHLYRAKHLSAEHSIAMLCIPSISPSVTLRFHSHIDWVTLQVISREISLESLLSRAQDRQSSPRGTSLNFPRNRAAVAVFNRKPAISLKWAR